MSIKRHLAVGFVLASGVVALTGSALAAPPVTPPGQEKKAEEAAATPAPAAAPAEQPAQAAPAEKTPPGQAKKAEPAPAPAPATAPAPAATSTGGKASAPGQEKKATSSSTSSSSSSAKTQGVNSTQAGVKPSNDTTKHTNCFTGGAMPSPSCTGGTVSSNAGGTRAAGNDHSKRYGNGTTAAQIAVSRGAPAATEIRGPGNSQPHKVCGKNGNWVDVHAVKTYAGICTESTSTPPLTTAVTPPTTVSCPTSTSQVVSTAVGHETGNGKIVWISPSQSSAHFKHGDAVVQVTLTLATGATCSVVVQTPTVTQAMPVVTQVTTTIERVLGTTVVSTTATPSAAAASAASPATAVSSTPAAGGVAGAAGGVAGVQETQAAGGPAAGVAGAFGVLGQAAGGALPFTGFPLWMAVLIAIVLIAMGWALWRRGRPAATRDVV